MNEAVKKTVRRMLVTKINDKIVTAIYEDGKMFQVSAVKEGSSLVGNIYIGKIKNIVKNINAAFVDIGGGKMCYLSLENVKLPVLTKSSNGKIHIESELVVQVEKDDVKTKAPVATTAFSLTGRYLVLVHSKSCLGVSGKIDDKAVRERLRKIVSSYAGESYGFIIRTNAANAAKEEIEKEAETLVAQYKTLISDCRYKTVYSCLLKNDENFLNMVRDCDFESFDEIITDELELHERLKKYFEENNPQNSGILKFMPKECGNLVSIYSLKSSLKEALSKNVWLKSGGYLVIEPTEALTVIDVNTGKAINGKKGTKETFLKINLEAADEIARQLRLRNISGIIVIDFINLEEDAYRNELLEHLKNAVKKDSIKTTVVDMTELELVEVTRKKVTKPLYEQMSIEDLNYI